MLYVAFNKLTAGTQRDLLARGTRLGVHQRHHVLQLIALAVRAARLVVAASGPQPARQRLIHAPAIGQHVERRVGWFDLYRAERVPPVLQDRLEGFVRDSTPRKRCANASAAAPLFAAPMRNTISRSCSERGRTSPAALRMDRAPHRHDPTGVRRIAAGLAPRAVAADEFGAITGHGPRRIVDGRKIRPIPRTRCCTHCARKPRRTWVDSVVTCIADFVRKSPSTHST